MRVLRTIVALTAAAYAVGAPAEALRGAAAAAPVAPVAVVDATSSMAPTGSGTVVNADGSTTFTFPGVSAKADGVGTTDVAPAPTNKQAFAGEERDPRDVAKQQTQMQTPPVAPATPALAVAGDATPTAGPVVNADGSATFNFPSVGVKPATGAEVVTAAPAKQAFAGEEENRDRPDNKAAWAGEEDERIAGDNQAFAGIDNHFRLAVNTVRVKDGADPLVKDVPLKLAAFKMAQELAAADKPDLDEKIGGKDVLQRAKDEGFKGEAVQALLHTEDVTAQRDVNDREGAVIAATTKWTASKDATAAIDEPTHRYIGSMGYLSASGSAYYVTLLGK